MKRFLLSEFTLERILKSIRYRFVYIINVLAYRLLSRKENINNSHSFNKIALLLANGPSLSKTEFDRINPEIDIYGMNRVYIDETINKKLKGLFVVNRLVLRQFMGDFKNLDYPVITSASNYLSTRKSKFVVLDSNLLGAGFSSEIKGRFNPSSTVTYFGLQYLFAIGYEKVFIVGLDHNFGNQTSVNKTEVVKEDNSHFRKDYFPKGIKWETPDLYGSEYWYKRARLEYESAQKEVIDITIDGKCNVFDKGNIQDIYS